MPQHHTPRGKPGTTQTWAGVSVITPARRRNPVTTTHVEPVAWETALALAGGEKLRLQVISATTVIVHNHPLGLS